MPWLRAVLPVLALVLVVSACAPASAGTLTVRGAWVRAAPGGATTAAYLDIANGTGVDDALVTVTTDAAAAVSIHETATDEAGMTGMHHAPTLAIPAGRSTALAPGGYHIMLDDLAEDLAPGASVRLVLTFERAGDVQVVADVRGS